VGFDRLKPRNVVVSVVAARVCREPTDGREGE
jgi:hypothetical protein